MSPLKIEALLHLRACVHPFEGYTHEQRFSPAMREAFAFFQGAGLLQPGVGINTRWESLKPEKRLTQKGFDLIERLCSVEP